MLLTALPANPVHSQLVNAESKCLFVGSGGGRWIKKTPILGDSMILFGHAKDCFWLIIANPRNGY